VEKNEPADRRKSKEVIDIPEGMQVNMPKDEESDLIRAKFKEFVEGEIPDQKFLEAYGFESSKVLVKVFFYEPERDEKVVKILGDLADSVYQNRYFPFVKVLASADENIEVGSIYKLSDVKTLSIESSEYKDWVKNDFSKSGINRKGDEPQRYINNIFRFLGQDAFVPDPFDLESLDGNKDNGMYYISKRDIGVPVVKPEIFYP